MSTREALIAAGTQLAGTLSGPLVTLTAALAGRASRDPELARLLEDGLFDPRCDARMQLLERGIARTEVRAGAATRLIAGVGPSLLMHQLFSLGTAPDRAWLVQVVDEVLMPLISPCPHID